MLTRATVCEMNTAWDVEGRVWGSGEDRTIAHDLLDLVASLCSLLSVCAGLKLCSRSRWTDARYRKQLPAHSHEERGTRCRGYETGIKIWRSRQGGGGPRGMISRNYGSYYIIPGWWWRWMIIPGGDAPLWERETSSISSIPEPNATIQVRTGFTQTSGHITANDNLDLVRHHESGLTQQRHPFLTIPIITSTGRQPYTTYPHLGSTRHRRVRKTMSI
jgi:hypothetical protein